MRRGSEGAFFLQRATFPGPRAGASRSLHLKRRSLFLPIPWGSGPSIALAKEGSKGPARQRREAAERVSNTSPLTRRPSVSPPCGDPPPHEMGRKQHQTLHALARCRAPHRPLSPRRGQLPRKRGEPLGPAPPLPHRGEGRVRGSRAAASQGLLTGQAPPRAGAGAPTNRRPAGHHRLFRPGAPRAPLRGSDSSRIAGAGLPGDMRLVGRAYPVLLGGNGVCPRFLAPPAVIFWPHLPSS